MSGKKISDFFTPSPSRSNKRSRSSPEISGNPERRSRPCTMEHEKVGEMTLGQLMLSLNRLWDEKLTALASKEELNSLVKEVEGLREEGRKQSEEISNLKNLNRAVLAKVEDLESRSRRNNLIFKGIKCQGSKVDCKSEVQRFLCEVLGVTERVWINRAHFIGGGENKAIIAHFPEDGDMDLIMRQTRKLKGTGFVVHRDYTKEVRTKRSYLMAVRAELEKRAGRRRIPLIFDHLLVENLRLTWHNGKLMAGREEGGPALRRSLGVDITQFLHDLEANGPTRRYGMNREDSETHDPPPTNTAPEDAGRRGPSTNNRSYSTAASATTTQG